MRTLALATVVAAALLAGASAARASDVGANDDSAKFEPDGGAAMYARMAELGLRQTVIGVRFVPSDALVIQDKALLDRAIASATDAGLEVVLAVYPYPPREIEAGRSSASLFGSYVGVLASIYPQVRQFVIGNEPNQPAFWRPQFDAAGANLSAPSFGPYLAAAYDTLKGVDPDITVVGVGLSPRGNDRPTREEQHLDVPRPLPACARHLVPAERPHEATHGRVQLPSVPERGDGSPRARLPVAERGVRQPRPAQAGALGRVPRHGSADDARRPEAPPGRGGLAGRHAGRVGYRGLENVPVTDEASQAAIYGQIVRDGGLRSGHRVAQLLRLP